MKPGRKNRERLFKGQTPTIRLANRDDVALYLYAFRYANHKEPDSQYRELVMDNLAQFDHIRVLEDRNNTFPDGWAPVGLVKAMFNEWVLEPHVDWFPWATTRNKLRCSVAYLYQQRCSRDVGVAVVHSMAQYRRWFSHLKRYVPLFPAGKIPAGRPDGDEFLFYLRGRKRLEVV